MHLDLQTSILVLASFFPDLGDLLCFSLAATLPPTSCSSHKNQSPLELLFFCKGSSYCRGGHLSRDPCYLAPGWKLVSDSAHVRHQPSVSPPVPILGSLIMLNDREASGGSTVVMDIDGKAGLCMELVRWGSPAPRELRETREEASYESGRFFWASVWSLCSFAFCKEDLSVWEKLGCPALENE